MLEIDISPRPRCSVEAIRLRPATIRSLFVWTPVSEDLPRAHSQLGRRCRRSRRRRRPHVRGAESSRIPGTLEVLLLGSCKSWNPPLGIRLPIGFQHLFSFEAPADSSSAIKVFFSLWLDLDSCTATDWAVMTDAKVQHQQHKIALYGRISRQSPLLAPRFLKKNPNFNGTLRWTVF